MRVGKSMFGRRFRNCASLAMAGLIALTVSTAIGEECKGSLAGKHVAFLVGEGVQDAETLVPLGYVVNRGAKVTVVGRAPGLVKAYNSEIRVFVEKAVDDVSPDEFDGLVIPGGRSPANLREHESIVDFARKLTEAGKPVAAICHGPQVLITAGVLDGKNATAFAGISGELREGGAHYTDAPLVRDGNIITSRLPKDLPDFCAAFEEALLGK